MSTLHNASVTPNDLNQEKLEKLEKWWMIEQRMGPYQEQDI